MADYGEADAMKDKAEALAYEGIMLMDQNKIVKALEKFKQSVAIAPCAAFYSNMALCYDKIGELLNFEKASRKCIDVDPSYAMGFARLGRALLLLWKYDEAMEVVKRGLDIDREHPRLQGLKDVLRVQIGFKKMLQTDVLKAERPRFRFFGGLRPGIDECKIPEDSDYGRLERPVLPPQSKKFAAMLGAGKFDEAIRPVIQAFFTGDLRIEWSIENWTSEKEMEFDYRFRLNAYLTTDPVDSGPVIAVNVCLFELERYRDEVVHKVIFSKETSQNPKYHHLLDYDLLDSLRLVLLQRFFREKAILLISDNVEIQVLNSIFVQVSNHLNDAGLWKDVADFKMVETDVAVNLGHFLSAQSAVKLGEAMEASKNYKEAAKVYVEVAKGEVFPIIPRWTPEIMLRTFAGIAFKRAEDYIQAEEQYVAAVRSVGTNWVLSDDFNTDIGNAFNNMMVFYEVAHRAVVDGKRTDEEHRKIERACFMLVALLSVAGYRGDGYCTLFSDGNGGYRLFKTFLKREYKTPRKALRAIKDAFSSPSIGEYRRILFRCSKSNDIFMTMTEDGLDHGNTKREKAEEAAKAKANAREQFNRSQPNATTNFAFCSGCQAQKSPNELKTCPCKAVMYCTQECQRAHWKIHKRVCQFRKKKK